MENLLVATFQDKENAFDALKKLKDLHQLDDIMIYNLVVLQKKQKGFEVLYHDGPDTQDLPAAGAFTGSLIGAIGGPIGMAIGMLTGLMMGAVDEDDTETFFDETLHNINKRLQPGSYAIVMDVDEDVQSITDSYLESYNGTITRTTMTDQYNKYNDEQWAELNQQIDEEEKILQTAAEADKAAIKAKIKELKTKREELQKKFRARRENLKKRIQDKVESLKSKNQSVERWE